jgi:hypothetical protein
MVAVWESASTPTSIADTPVFAKIKSWLGSKGQVEPTN